MNDAAMQKRRRAKRRARKTMIEVAKRGETITYKKLAEDDAIPYAYNSTQLSDLLTEISRAEENANRGLLSVVVVRKADGIPGDGFFALAARVGRMWSDQSELLREERSKVHRAQRCA